MRAQVDGVGTGCGYLVAGFFAWERGALVKRRRFYAAPGRWVLTWGPGAAGGRLIRAGPWRRVITQVGAGDSRGYSERSEWPRGCDCMRGLDKNLSAATCSQAAIKPRFPGFIDSNPFVPVYCAA